MSWSDAISTAIGAVVGGGAVIYGQHLTAGRQADSEREAWSRRRNDQRADAERACLLELQEEGAHLGRLTARVLIADAQNHRQHSDVEYGTLPIPDELAEAHRESMMRLSLLRSRVSDGDLRGSIQEVIDGATGAITAPSRAEGDARLTAMLEAFARANDHVGRLLSSL